MRLFPIALALACAGGQLRADDEDAPTAAATPGHSAHGEAYDEGPRQAAYLMEGMPRISFPVTTTNVLAQVFFNQGIGQLHGFWYFEAERSFRQVAALDTNCLMAQWGMAMANVENPKRARDFIESAAERTNCVPLTRRESLYINSLAQFYATNAKKEKAKDKERDEDRDAEVKDPKRHRAYVRAFEQIVEEFPDDLEAKAFLAFKIWENSSRTEISSHTATDALAREILAADPMHPTHHARIHLWNGEADRRALDSAAGCGPSSPGIAHMWHMPGHTYSSLKRYADAAWQQEASARVDHAYMIRNRVLPDQIHNFAHNNEWLIRDLNHLGRVDEAVDLALNMIELPRHPKYNMLAKPDAPLDQTPESPGLAYVRRDHSASYGRARLVETLVRWELWDRLIALSETMYLEPTDIPEQQARRARALGLAYFAKGDTDRGARQMSAIEDAIKRQRELRHSQEDDAETRTRKAKESDDQVVKAMTDVLKAHTERIKGMEHALEELRLYQSLATGETNEARKLIEELKDVPKERLARAWLQLGDKGKAEDLAREAVEASTNQVQVLANYVDILESIGKQEEADKAFAELRFTAAQAGLDLPVMQRAGAVAKRQNLSDDWRKLYVESADVGNRPVLDVLGPFRWHPSPAPDWSLPDAQGRAVSLASYRGRPVVVIFYLGHGCVHCIEQLNAFAPAARRFLDAGLEIVAIGTDSTDGLQKTFAKSKSGEGFPFLVLSDEAMDVFKRYRAYDDFERMPLHGTFLVDGAGLVRWQDISYEPFTHVDFLLDEARRLLKLPINSILVSAAHSANPRSEASPEILGSPKSSVRGSAN